MQPYGHDLSWLNTYEGKLRSEEIRIGFIGQISESKGVHLLLEAARLLVEKANRKFRLYIYGNLKHDPGYSATLRDLVRGLENVEFCGTYLHAQSAGVFAGIDVLVVPSIWYDFPLVIYEAFATQTPVIATNLGGMAEAVEDEVNGLLFERNDANDLARQLRRIIDEPGLLERLRSGIPEVKRIEQEVEELEQIYTELINLQPNHRLRRGI